LSTALKNLTFFVAKQVIASQHAASGDQGVASGWQWYPAPRLLHTFNIVLKKMGPSVVFVPPCCEILTTGLAWTRFLVCHWPCFYPAPIYANCGSWQHLLGIHTNWREQALQRPCQDSAMHRLHELQLP